MASGKSSSVTLQPLLPDRAYKVTVSAVHYTGESESTTATGRTGECIHQYLHLHQLSSIRLGVTSPGAALSFLCWAVAVAKVLLSKLQKAWKREKACPGFCPSHALLAVSGWTRRVGDHTGLEPGVTALNSRAHTCTAFSFSSCDV